VTQGILIFLAFAFLLHSMLLYFALHRGNMGRAEPREFFIFAAAAVAVVLLVVFLLPPDFVRNAVVLNRLSDPPKPDIVPLDERGEGRPGGSLQSERNGQEERNGHRRGEGGQNMLEGIPADQWGDQGSGEGSESRQYAVMVTASPVDPIYAAEAYFDRFDPRRGFVLSADEPLNDLVFQRLLETWRNQRANIDLGRRESVVFFLSTIPERVLPYDPRAIEPTVFSTIFHPFDYTYTATSAISMTGTRQWGGMRGFTTGELEELAPYLEIPLEPEHRERFQAYLDGIVTADMSLFERIRAILTGFSVFQYNIGFDEDVSPEKMVRFLFETREGDCTEFSNSSAMLARLAGIPARVVTGYLSSKGLQTPAHRRGIQALRQAVEPLREFPESELNLVTTAHHHSWVQFRLPDYGWVDFETTAFAIPPMGFGDPNNMNVVIPLIQPEPAPPPAFEFPWRLALRILTFLTVVCLLGLYTYRYGRRLALGVRARGTGTRALRALYTVTLMRLAEEGRRIKRPAETATEYAQDHPELERFSREYTRLRYKESYRRGEEQRLWRRVRRSQRAVLEASRRRGPWNWLKRLLTLRGIGY